MAWIARLFDRSRRVYAAHILKAKPNAKIGILFQNDDYGRIWSLA